MLGKSIPIDIAPLRTVPNLRCLDLSKADVSGLDVPDDLPELRYLALSSQQWTDLLGRGKVPPTLAAARLADDEASFDDALTWAARLGLNTEGAFRTTGDLDIPGSPEIPDGSIPLW